MKLLKLGLLFMSFFLLLSLLACGSKPGTTQSSSGSTPSPDQAASEYEIVDYEDSPEVVKAKIDALREQESTEVVEVEESIYIVITMGQQPTTGYEIKIQNVIQSESETKIIYEYIKPGANDIVGEALTYPVAIVKLPKTEKKISFEKMEAQEASGEAKTSTSDSSTHASLQFDQVQVGDKVGDFQVLEADFGSGETAYVAFEGKVTLKGTFELNLDHEFIDGIAFWVAEDSQHLLPKWSKDERTLWFTFKNHDQALEWLNIQSQYAKGTATITIDEYDIRYAPTEIWNEAMLIEVIESSIEVTE